MKKIIIKKDTEGRFYLPKEIRKELGNTLILKNPTTIYSPANNKSLTKNSEKQ